MACLDDLFSHECSHFGGPLTKILDFVSLTDLFRDGIWVSCKFLNEYIPSYLENRLDEPNSEEILEFFNDEVCLPSDSLFSKFLKGKTYRKHEGKELLILLIFSFKKRLDRSFHYLVERFVGVDETEEESEKRSKICDSTLQHLEELLKILCGFTRSFDDRDYHNIQLVLKYVINIEPKQTTSCIHRRVYYQQNHHFYPYNPYNVENKEKTSILFHILNSSISSKNQFRLNERFLREGRGGISTKCCIYSAIEKNDLKLFMILSHIKFFEEKIGPTNPIFSFLSQRIEEVIEDEITFKIIIGSKFIDHLCRENNEKSISSYFNHPKVWNEIKTYFHYSMIRSSEKVILNTIPEPTIPIIRKYVPSCGCLSSDDDDESKQILLKRFPNLSSNHQQQVKKNENKIEELMSTRRDIKTSMEKISIYNSGFFDGGTSRKVLLFGHPKITSNLMMDNIQKVRNEGNRFVGHTFITFDEKKADYSGDGIEMIVLCFDCSDICSLEYCLDNLFVKHPYFSSQKYYSIYLCVGIVQNYCYSREKSLDIGYQDVEELISSSLKGVEYMEVFLQNGSDVRELEAVFGKISSKLSAVCYSLI